ncbi:MAG: TorD/DmsD family molecular chaperone [Desulfitobacteriia bacterium]|jgi:TorA maturation chaperone TorD
MLKQEALDTNLESQLSFAGLLELLADLYKFPDEELYADLESGLIDVQIRELSRAAGREVLSTLQPALGSYQELLASYNDCFLGVKAASVPPVESVYKVWTTDESYQVPFKKRKGYLMGDSALHIKHILNSLNLEIPPEYELMPDHLTILLELYAFFLRRGFLKEARQFREDHLDWLPDFYAALKQEKPKEFYTLLTAVLIKVLAD